MFPIPTESQRSLSVKRYSEGVIHASQQEEKEDGKLSSRSNTKLKDVTPPIPDEIKFGTPFESPQRSIYKKYSIYLFNLSLTHKTYREGKFWKGEA